MTAAARQLDALCHLTAQSMTSLETSDHFQVIKLLGEGSYGKVMLAVHRKRGTPMALKLFPRGSTSLISFLREYNLSLSFCTHPSLTRALGIVFSTPSHYVFAQQAALYGDLYDIIVPEVGVEEPCVQRVMSQLSGALSHLHSLGFVHRDVKPENVFLCDRLCHWVKLGDFGMVKPRGAQVPAVWYESPYCTPETEAAKGRKGKIWPDKNSTAGERICKIEVRSGGPAGVKSEKGTGKGDNKNVLWVSVETSIDSWALGILVYSMLTGSYPWKETSSDDPGYRKYREWFLREKEQAGPNPIAPQFAVFTPLAHCLFQELLNPQPWLRARPEQVLGYLGGDWILKKGGGIEGALREKQGK
ncbi:serine/threonine-protein kinase SBK1-like [Megalops cyprinoides]|uniref:serine/threonine-protein kinase SBK1-like n=1 Tax=Megalops cyprinoides TaxID=118141 RepID=UPI0018643274|nr:serine/threonine-protein kinase SBK1-like [Megalops cyprinoides]